MHALLRIPAAAAILCSTSLGFEDSDAILRRFLERIRTDLDRLPNLVCAQDVDRFRRSAPDQDWRKLDTLRLEVAAIGGQELYSRAGERKFQSRPLAEQVGRGTTGTGQFANFAKNVFGHAAADFTFKGRTEQDGTPAYEFALDIAADRSGYKLRAGTAESVVAFQGLFWISASTLDLLRLEVQAYDIPDKLGIAQADTAVVYTRAAIGGEDVLLPGAATLTIVAMDGVADMNRSRLSSCRQYRTESALRFDAAESGDAERAAPVQRVEPAAAEAELPGRTFFELALESALDPSTAAVGDPVSAKLLNSIKDGAAVLIPQGARVVGRIVRLQRQALPFPTYEIGLEFNSANAGGRAIPLSATMIDAGPAAGLIRQSRRLEPTFTRRRDPRLNILVREVQRGQGILTWDGRRGAVPAGLKMKWRVTPVLDRN